MAAFETVDVGTIALIQQTEEGRMLKDNVETFLSSDAVYNAFLGYSQNQLRRLKNAMARDSYTQSEKEQHLLESIQKRMNTGHCKKTL